jgi:hypothetical protein
VTEITVSDTQAITPHNQALYDAGKEMLVDSISVGRDFCKFMVGVATGAVPLYLGLLALGIPKDYRPAWWWEGVALVAPGLVFLAAAAVFALGFFPRTGAFSLDLPDQIDQARQAAISTRPRFSTWGFVLFGVGAIATIAVVIWAFRIQAPAAPAGKPIQVQLIK